MYREDTIDILASVVAAMQFPVAITGIASVGDMHTLKVCDIYHVQNGFSVTIGGNSYQVVDFQYPDTIVVQGSQPIMVDAFEMYRPYFFHGTPVESSAELQQNNNAFTKYPMIWVMENFRDVFYDFNFSSIERDIRASIFFLTTADHSRWLTANAYKEAIQPMRRLEEQFMRTLVGMSNRFLMDEFDEEVENYAKFGVYIREKGMDKNLLADELAGCELKASKIRVYFSGNCPPDCP
jgi:hypothetical protein